MFISEGMAHNNGSLAIHPVPQMEQSYLHYFPAAEHYWYCIWAVTHFPSH